MLGRRSGPRGRRGRPTGECGPSRSPGRRRRGEPSRGRGPSGDKASTRALSSVYFQIIRKGPVLEEGRMEYFDEIGQDQVGTQDGRLEVVVPSSGAHASSGVPDSPLGHQGQGGEARVEGGEIGPRAHVD